VLLAADGQPMLLDFHLAREPLPAGAPAPAGLGGTPGWMAPEHEAALRAVAEGRAVPAAVDGRSDLYALGRLLAELLGASAGGSPAVSGGLAALLARCLARDPAHRYPDAASLADDLRRHLADRPLRGVPDRHPLERWRKWRRRRPYTLPLILLLLAVVTAGAGLAAHAIRQAGRARAALAEGQAHLERHQYAEAAEQFRHGSALAEGLPLVPELRRRLHAGRARAERGQAAHELHHFCERISPLYGTGPLPPSQLRAVLERCRRLWQQRERLRGRLQEQPDPAPWRQARADLLDLAIVWAHLRVRLAPPGQAARERRAALALLSQAGEELGPSCVLHQERHGHALALGLTGMAEEAARQAAARPPGSAWEHFALGRAHYLAGDWPRALRELDRALELEPRALWPTFYRGCCACKMRRYDDAIVAFSVCHVLAGDRAWCLYNRGLAYLEVGQLDRARRDLDRALTLEPNFAAAALSRGTLHYREGRLAQAVTDLERALAAGLDSAAVRYNLALVYLARHDRAASLASARLALRHDPGHAQARRLLERLGADR
jgi:tetratricopeptide (TPR) repeat protein